MSDIEIQQCNLNIWYYLSDEEWNKVSNIYESMPGWMGYINKIPYWFGQEDDEVFILASVEPSGLSFHARMSNSDWVSWIGRFKWEATKVLGFDVGEPEEGFI